MLLLVPYEIETLNDNRPWANWLLIAACCVLSIGALSNAIEIEPLVLNGFKLPGFIAHMFVHVGFMHLLGNMVFLWVFGNAICTNTNNFIYLAVFFACGALAATMHVLLDGSPAIGASGAINGIVGMIFAMYPVNRVHMFWIFMIRGGTFTCRAWTIILAWFVFDIWGAYTGGGHVAYWAHIGGFLGGLLIGLIGLHFRWFQLTEYDNRSLLEIIKRQHPEEDSRR